MLPNVANGSARRCSARANGTGEICRNPAVTGCRTCRFHGGHKKVRRSTQHWNYRGAGQTLPERKAHQIMSAFFHETEGLMFALGITAPGSKRTRGRKPKVKAI